LLKGDCAVLNSAPWADFPLLLLYYLLLLLMRLLKMSLAKLTIALSLTISGLSMISAPASAKAKVRKAVIHTRSVAKTPLLDADTAAFSARTANISNAPECFPIHIRDERSIGIVYQYCSTEAVQKDGDAVEISDQFQVPQSIARRYNFWRRIYSLWGKDQYVLHVSQYPEIVLEAFDASRLGDHTGPVAKEIAVKKVAKLQKDNYRRMLISMHQYRKSPELFTPAMKRVAESMAHIPDSDKFLVAARSMRLQRGQRDFIATGLTVAPKYLPHIEEEFKGQDIPVEITRLAFVESSFNLSAHSKVGASGVYQIMPATGRQYLKMHSGIDERNEPIKASRAAAKLLRLNYKLTGNWPLAITAYNHGVGGIKKAVKKVGTNDIAELINKYNGNAFGFASKNFYASFLGVLATLKEADRLFPEIAKVQPLAYTNLKLTKSMSISQIKKKYSLTTTEIAEMNPDISRSVIRSQGWLPKGYVLKLPSKPEQNNVLTASDNPNS
jgi:membrane-bound lytic murein transglycosylase D